MKLVKVKRRESLLCGQNVAQWVCQDVAAHKMEETMGILERKYLLLQAFM